MTMRGNRAGSTDILDLWGCFMGFIAAKGAAGARALSLSALIGSIIMASIPMSYQGTLSIIFIIVFIVFMFSLFILLITSLGGLTDALHILVVELNGKAPFGRIEVPQCFVKYFSGKATEVLGRFYRLFFLLTFIILLILIPFTLNLTLRLMMGPNELPNAISAIPSLLSKKLPSAMNTTVEIALGIFGIVLTRTLGSLLPGGGTADVEVLRIAHGVRFHSLTWFFIAIILVIVSVVLPPLISILLLIPLVLAIAISLVIYLVLSITAIERMQLP
jgi:hypothetical protein